MKRIIFFFSFFLMMAVAAFGQDSLIQVPMNPPDISTGIGVNVLLEWSTWLYAAIITLLNYLSPIVPGVKNISNTFLRVLTFSLVLIGLWFYALTNGTVSDAIQLSISFLLASGLLHPALKSVGVAEKLVSKNAVKVLIPLLLISGLSSFSHEVNAVVGKEKTKERTYWVACEYKTPGMPEHIVTLRVTTAYWMTENQEFLNAVIRDLKESGVVPDSQYFDRPATAWLSIVSIEPIPADVVFSTTDPNYDPKITPE